MKQDKAPLFDQIKRYHELHHKVVSNKFSQEDYTEYLSYGHSLSPIDIIGFLVQLVNTADNVVKNARVCNDEVEEISDHGWATGNKIKACNTSAEDYLKLRKEVIK